MDLSHTNNLEIKILLGFTQAATKFSFPIRIVLVLMKKYLCLTKIKPAFLFPPISLELFPMTW